MSYLRNISFFCLLLPALAAAQVTHVTLWEPLPGKVDEMMQTAAQGVALNTKLGAQSGIAVDTHGRLHFFLTFDNWAQWGEHQAKAQTNDEMQAFIASYTNQPSAVQLESYMLNSPLAGAPGNVYNVFVWEAFEGRSSELMEKAMQGSQIHSKAGANISIGLDQLGRVHYVMSFDSWTDWGKFQDTPSAEWAEFMGGFRANPPGEIVQTFMASQVPQ